MKIFPLLLFTTLLAMNTFAFDLRADYQAGQFSVGHYQVQIVDGGRLLEVSGHDNQILTERGEGTVSVERKEVLGHGKMDTGAGVGGTGDIGASLRRISTAVTGDIVGVPTVTRAGVGGERGAREINGARAGHGHIPVIGPGTRVLPRPRPVYQRHQSLGHRQNN